MVRYLRSLVKVVDGLVELPIGLIHRINARAERRVEKELIGDLASVPGKRGIYTKMIDAALERPDDTVREAVYPAVPGGVKTLSALARELKATERAVAERVRYQLRGSYSHYYRRMLAPLLAALEFRCNNSAYRPVMDAIGLLARYAGTDSDQKLYAAGEKVPVDGVVPKAWLDGVVDDERPGGADPVRAVRADRAAGGAAAARGLRPGRGPVEGPGRGPARRLRGQPRRPLLRARQAPGRRRVHRRAPQAPGRRAHQAQQGPGQGHQRRRPDHHQAGQPVGERPQARQAARAEEPRRAQGRGPAPVGHHRPARHPEGHRVHHRLQRLLRLRRHPRGARPRHPEPAAAAGAVRARHEHGHPADGRHRRARRRRGRAPARPRHLRHPREPAGGDHHGRQRHPRGPRPGMVGRGDQHRVGLQAVRVLGLQPDDRVPRPLRRLRRDDLLARRARPPVRLLPAEVLLVLRGRGDDRGPAAARHRRRDRGQLHRHPRRQPRGVRVHRAARLQAPAPAEEHRRDPALRPRPRPRPRGRSWRRSSRKGPSTGS